LETQMFVVSNPPHGAIDDIRPAARCFDLSPAEARMKANFKAPEVWISGDRESLESKAKELREAGFNVAVVDPSALLETPHQHPVEKLEFTDTELLASVGECQVRLPYDAKVFGVFCRPPAEVPIESRKIASLADSLGKRSITVMMERGTSSPGSVAEALERTAFVDLYLSDGAEIRRISVAQGITDFSGLGQAKAMVSSANVNAFILECERRFEDLDIDDRLVDVRPRQRPMVGTTNDREDRRLFSFGTLALSALLESVSPELKDLTQYDLGSRLSYLMRR